MIIVIADDFTGAAELAGISLRYGLTVELFTENILPSNADVVIVSTDSRSLRLNDALIKIKSILHKINGIKPAFIYKKIDSVLRGYVMEEIKLQMQIMQQNKAFVLPANPSLGRTIKDEKYFINNMEINKTNFANDPEFPITNASVKNMLKDNDIFIKDITENLPTNGIVVGEATTTDDINFWAKNIKINYLLAGAADFYEALLQQKFNLQNDNFEFEIIKPFLFVAGSTFKNSIQNLQNSFLKKTYLSDCIHLINPSDVIFVLAIDDSKVNITPLELRKTMAILTKQLFLKKNIKELFIEGGSTVASILTELNINKLVPTNELSRGVVRMKANDLFITVKPGSYVLPNKIGELLK